MIRFFSAAFGQAYIQPAKALVRSFDLFAPDAQISIFTDLPNRFGSERVIKTAFGELIDELDQFHRSTDGQLRNAFKFLLFDRMRQLYPEDDLCWIDADMLVFTDLSRHLRPGFVNVMAHGRRDEQLLNLGDDLTVRGDRYAIGGLYSLPPGPALDFVFDAARARQNWGDVDRLVRFSGDQITLNHVVARSGLPVHWVSDDRRFIYNLEFGENTHPIVGDAGLKAIEMLNGIPVRDGREFAVFCWIKNKLDAHIADRFSTFSPEVADLLRKLYE
jgi:hypothetical protein